MSFNEIRLLNFLAALMYTTMCHVEEDLHALIKLNYKSGSAAVRYLKQYNQIYVKFKYEHFLTFYTITVTVYSNKLQVADLYILNWTI